MYTFKGEEKIKQIGGAAWDDYTTFRRVIIQLNAYVIPFCTRLGFGKEDKDLILKVIIKGDVFSNFIEPFIERTTDKVVDGKIKIERFLTRKVLEQRNETAEKRGMRILGQLRKSLRKIYKDLKEEYFRECDPPTYYGNYVFKGLNRSDECLELEPDGFSINTEKYLELYEDMLETKGCITYEKHKKVADAINSFFGKSIEINQKELERYFIISNGKIAPNPDAVNKQSYLRLGYKSKKTRIHKY